MISSSLRRPVKMASNSRTVSAALRGWPAWAKAKAAGKSTAALVTFMAGLSCRFFGEVARDLQEIIQKGVAILRGDAFGMKLHPVHRMALMHHALDHAVFGCRGDFQACRHARRIDGQGMIARRQEIIVEAAEYRLAAVMHAGKLAMHGLGRAHDL